jgi:polysaccharide export outer membrane protein
MLVLMPSLLHIFTTINEVGSRLHVTERAKLYLRVCIGAGGVDMRVGFAFGLISLLYLAGCASLPPLPPAEEQSSLAELASQRQQLTSAAYAIGPEDVVQIAVYGQPDLSREVTVSPDGTFVYPFIGKVQASGLTLPELERQLAQRLADGYLVDPQLTVTLIQSRSRQAYVLGAVNKPGAYPVKHNTTLVELLSQAGGPTPEAGWYTLLVRDAGASKRTGARPDETTGAVRIDLDRLVAGELSQPITIASGDTIYVPPATYFFVYGQVQDPGRYRLERHTTVIQAIAIAGGFTQFARKKSLRVRRVIDGKSQEFQAQPHDRLQAEDVLIVPESIL